MEKGLIERTGKDLQHWIGVLKASGLEKHGQMLQYLKKEHGFTHGFANFVALKTREADAASSTEEELIDHQYKGKASLKKIFDEIVRSVSELGSDIEVAPKKSNVSFRGRKRQFLLIQPSTKTRLDLGLKYTTAPSHGQLKDAGPFGSMCTHSLSLQSADELTDDVIGLIAEAYRQSH